MKKELTRMGIRAWVTLAATSLLMASAVFAKQPDPAVVKLAGKRHYQVPGFEESKNLLQAAVVQNRRAALLKKLSDAAVVK